MTIIPIGCCEEASDGYPAPPVYPPPLFPHLNVHRWRHQRPFRYGFNNLTRSGWSRTATANVKRNTKLIDDALIGCSTSRNYHSTARLQLPLAEGAVSPPTIKRHENSRRDNEPPPRENDCWQTTRRHDVAHLLIFCSYALLSPCFLPSRKFSIRKRLSHACVQATGPATKAQADSLRQSDMKPLHTKRELSYHHHVTTSAGKQLAVTSWRTNFFSGFNYFNAGFLPFVLHTEHPEAGEHTAALVPKRRA